MTLPLAMPTTAVDDPDILVERIAAGVYARLRADLLMGDDMLIDEDELALVMRREPEVMATWRKLQVGPQFTRLPGAKGKYYRIGAIRRYLDQVRAGPMHVEPFLTAQAELERRKFGRQPKAAK